MIKLDTKVYDKIKIEYLNEITNIIKRNYQKSNKLFFDKIKIIDFFETNNSIDENKIKQILVTDFVNIENNNLLIINYFKTGLFIYNSDFIISKELKKLGIDSNVSNRQNYRKEYVNKYMNEWIKEKVEIHSQYYLTSNSFQKLINEIKIEFTKLNTELAKIIKYEYISSTLRHRIITSSNITVCPYCNRQYISYFDEGQKGTADLDHFFPKGKFSLFALSLYNFIPSCQVCNQRFKIDKYKNILYPFKAGFEDNGKFGIGLNDKTNVDTLYFKNTNFDLKINIKESSENKEEIENSVKMFHLESLYEHHKPYIQELLQKKYLIYSPGYLKMIEKTFKELKLSENELENFLYGFTFDEEKDKNKILGKLTKDILKK